VYGKVKPIYAVVSSSFSFLIEQHSHVIASLKVLSVVLPGTKLAPVTE